jgi:hypothetical protein
MEKRFVSRRKSSIFATEKSKSEKSASRKQQKKYKPKPKPLRGFLP